MNMYILQLFRFYLKFMNKQIMEDKPPTLYSGVAEVEHITPPGQKVGATRMTRNKTRTKKQVGVKNFI